jgi:hypothetical protein
MEGTIDMAIDKDVWTSFWLVVTHRSCLQRTVCSTS